MKTFDGHIKDFYTKIKNGENFAFSRYSDGELFILQNKELVLGQDVVKVGNKNIKRGSSFKPQDFKHFDPNKHSYYREVLIESLKHNQKNYFKGISCSCCVGKEDFNWQLELAGGDNDYITWANLFVNGNYPFFIQKITPLLYSKKIVFIGHHDAKLEKLKTKMDIVKDFRVGYNAMINDYNKIEEMSNWIESNNISDHVFIFSASTFTNLAIFELYKKFDNNTYLDTGTCFAPFIEMPTDRGYLESYWSGRMDGNIKKICVWN